MNKRSLKVQEPYALLEDTISALFLLNPIKHGIQVDAHSVDPESGVFTLNYVTEDAWRQTSGRIYECGLGYYCVVIDDDIWCAPVVWNDPRIIGDTETNADLLDGFAEHVREALWTRQAVCGV